MNTIETWIISPDNPKYEVSSFGRIRNKKRGNIIKQKITIDGYHRVCLSESGLRHGKSWSVARLVAKAFIPNPDNLPQVNHIDGNKDNNSVSNLEWCTAKQNIAHGIEHGLICHDESTVTIIHKRDLPRIYGLRKLGLAYKQIAKMYQVHTATIAIIFKNNRVQTYYDEDEFKKLVDAFCEENLGLYSRWDNRTIDSNGRATRRILQKDNNGNVLKYYDSISSAARENGVLCTSICNNLRGLSKSCGGYKYEYQ